jgi:phosphatidylinositol-3-phosphatase
MTPPLVYQHVVWIVMENKAYSQVIGSPDAPYINNLAGQCGLATNFYAEGHPSLPNYIAMTSGSTQGITDDKDPSYHPLSAASIFSQLGTTAWRSLQESMPTNCYPVSSGLYLVRHNPAAYYTNIATDCLSQDAPLLDPVDLSARFTFVTPNECDDMHSCPAATTSSQQVQSGDSWLSTFMPKLLNSTEYQSGAMAIFLTWDEDNGSAQNHVPTVVISPYTTVGTTSGIYLTHYSLLRTTEEMLGVGTYLDNAAAAASMRGAFNL